MAWLFLAGHLTGCTTASGPVAFDAQPIPERTGDVHGAAAGGAEARLVAVGSDPDGCLMYRLDAPDRRKIEAIVYRTADGRITFDRGEADCSLPAGSERTTDLPAGARG